MSRTHCSRWRALATVGLLLLLLGLCERSARAEPSESPGLSGDLLARAASADPAIRMAAVPELEALATPAAMSLLTVMVSGDNDPRVRTVAAVALGNGRNPDAQWAVERAAAYDPDPSVRLAATAAVARLTPFGRRPKMAAGLSVLCPGCGYFYLHQPQRAATYLGTAGALLGSALLVVDASPVDATGHHATGRAMPLLTGLQNLWFYGIYASYRDARLARDDDAFSRNSVAREELTDLVLAPFNPRVLRSPYVWAGLPALIGGAIGYGYLISRFTSVGMEASTRTLGDPGGVTFFGRRYGTGTGFALGSGYNLVMFDSVASGEEALFRGALQAGLSETSLGVWGGWAVGSAIFGAVHAFNFIGEEQGFKTAAMAVPYITLTGAYLGYVFIRKNFSLLAGTALHFWYDFALSTMDFIADPDHQPFVARFAVPF